MIRMRQQINSKNIMVNSEDIQTDYQNYRYRIKKQTMIWQTYNNKKKDKQTKQKRKKEKNKDQTNKQIY